MYIHISDQTLQSLIFFFLFMPNSQIVPVTWRKEVSWGTRNSTLKIHHFWCITGMLIYGNDLGTKEYTGQPTTKTMQVVD